MRSAGRSVEHPRPLRCGSKYALSMKIVVVAGQSNRSGVAMT